MSKPLNFRFRFLAPQEMKGQPTIPCNVPNNPANPMQFVVVPTVLEIEIFDVEQDKSVWIEIPFHMPEAPIIQIESATMPRRRN